MRDTFLIRMLTNDKEKDILYQLMLLVIKNLAIEPRYSTQIRWIYTGFELRRKTNHHHDDSSNILKWIYRFNEMRKKYRNNLKNI